MGVRIIYSDFANDDLKKIFDFISKGSVFYAKREVNSLRLSVKKLKKNIYLGKAFAKADDENTRELIIKHYRIIYQINASEERIDILTIHHHARSIERNPAFNEED